MKGKLYIRTFGCQMNVKDSERAAGMLIERGFERAEAPEDADVLLVNTCSVREKPEQKVFGALGRWKAIKERRPEAVMGVMGCVAQQFGEEFLNRVPHLDFVMGTGMVHRLPELVERARQGMRSCAVDFPERGDGALFAVPDRYHGSAVSSFVSIMQGCDNYCAYCIVPYVRGPAVSRERAAVLDEVAILADSGVREVTLLGQNVNAYADGTTDFPGLLATVADVPGIARVRFTTSHPKDLSEALIETVAGHPRLMEHVHLPVQAGADAVLGAMNRGYDRAGYVSLVNKLRLAMPEVGLTTDLIVGFPGESAEDFEDTLSLLREVRYDETFSFRYSKRPGTRAEDLDGQVDESEKYERLYRLQELQRSITEKKNIEQVGLVHEVLVEGPSKTDPGRLSGRSRTNRLVHFETDGARPGEIVEIKISKALKHSLAGETARRGPGLRAAAGEESCLSR